MKTGVETQTCTEDKSFIRPQVSATFHALETQQRSAEARMHLANWCSPSNALVSVLANHSPFLTMRLGTIWVVSCMIVSSFFVRFLMHLSWVGILHTSECLCLSFYRCWIVMEMYYRSGGSRTLPYHPSIPIGVEDMTPFLCMDRCNADGWAYGGFEYSQECCKFFLV